MLLRISKRMVALPQLVTSKGPLHKLYQSKSINKFTSKTKFNMKYQYGLCHKNFFSFSISDSISSYETQIAEARKQFGQNSQQELTALHKLSVAYMQGGRIQEAVKTYESVVNKFRTNLNGQKTPLLADSLKNLQTFYNKSGKIMESIPLTLQIIDIRKAQLGQNHNTVATEYNLLGIAYYQIQNMNQAFNYYNKALEIRKKLYKQDSLEYLEVLNNIGAANFAIGKLPEAKEIFIKNIGIIKDMGKEKQQFLVSPMTNLAAIYDQQGNYQESLKLFKDIQEISTKISQQSPHLANIYRSLGIVTMKMGDIAKAEQYHRKSLQINLKFFPQNHPSIAANYHNIGTCLQYKKQYDEAIKIYNKAIQIRKKTLGQKHQSLIQTYNNLGIVYKYQRNFSQARKYYQMSIQILKFLGATEENNPNFGDIFINVGTTYLEEKNPQAQKYFLKAYNNYKIFFQENHYKFVDLFYNLSVVQKTFKNDLNKAKQYIIKSIEIQQRLVPQHPQLYVRYSFLADICFQLHDYNGSLDSFQKAAKILKILNQKQPNQSTIVNAGFINFQLGMNLFELQRYKQAEQMMEVCREFFTKYFPQTHQILASIYLVLGKCCALNSKPQDSKKYLLQAKGKIQTVLKNPEVNKQHFGKMEKEILQMLEK